MELADLLDLLTLLCAAVTSPDARRVAREGLDRVIPSDDIFWLRTDYAGGTVVAVHGADASEDDAVAAEIAAQPRHPVVASYLTDPSELTPRRLSDVPNARGLVGGDPLVRVLGRHQLSLITSLDGARGDGWVLTRDGADFSDDEVRMAAAVLPAFALFERALGDDSRPVTSAVCLTPREREVLTLLAHGSTAAAIGREIGISERTVGKHLEHVYRKLGCADRLSAVERARATGIL